MKIHEIAVSELTPYENNPRNNEKAVDAVAASIKEFGFKQPIVIDANNVVVSGHTRLLAVKKLGIAKVPCVIADDLTEEQIRAYRLADNKVAELAGWNDELLAFEMSCIEAVDMSAFGFPAVKTEEETLEQQKRDFEQRMEAGELSEDSEEYQEFLAKFEAKKTTDDCYTPPKVYDAVAEYVAKKYGLKKTSFVRPFVPGGDYENFDYPKGCAVVDNPPFSILAEILNFYKKNGIKFFLFAPALTLFSSSSSSSSSALCTGVGITYENGALVNTSFLTNLEPEEVRFRSAPELYRAVRDANEENLKAQRREIPKYSYPLEVVTAPMLTSYSRYGIEFTVNRDESYQVSALDSQKESKKAIFGKGYLISESKKAEREKAEREKAEREKAERWELSERELEIIKGLK